MKRNISLYMWNLHLKLLIILGLQISRATQQTQKKPKQCDRNNKLKKRKCDKICLSSKKVLSRQETINRWSSWKYVAVKKFKHESEKKKGTLDRDMLEATLSPLGWHSRAGPRPSSPSSETRSAGEQALAAGMDFCLLLAKPRKYHSPAGLYDWKKHDTLKNGYHHHGKFKCSYPSQPWAEQHLHYYL